MKRNRKVKRRLILLVLVLFVTILGWRVWARLLIPANFPLAHMQWEEPDSTTPKVPPLIIGHRGTGLQSRVDRRVIGNTRNAIEQGIRAGADWIEIDVRTSKQPNGTLVAFHDANIDQKTTSKGAVCDLSLAELKSVWLEVEPRERILTLDEVFASFGDRQTRWILDVKATGVQRALLAFLDARVASGQVSPQDLILFGDFNVLSEYRDSDYRMGLTVLAENAGNQFNILFNQSQVLRRTEELGCEYLVLPRLFASHSLIAAALEQGLKVWVYGVEKQSEIDLLTRRGVSGFIVDRPADFVSPRRHAPRD